MPRLVYNRGGCNNLGRCITKVGEGFDPRE